MNQNKMTTRPDKSSVLPAIIFVVGISILVTGIIIAKSSRLFPFEIELLKKTVGAHVPNYMEAAFGLLIALAGAFMAAYVARKLLPDKLAKSSLPSPVLKKDIYAICSFGLAVSCNVLLYLHLSSNRYSHWDILLFFAGLTLFGYSIHRLDNSRPASCFRFTRFDVVLLLLLVILTVTINLVDLTSWKWAWWGDEGEFFITAKNIVKEGNWNFFNLRGAYGYHPTLDSLIHAAGMKLFGVNVVGWRLSEIFLTAAAVILIYILGTISSGRLNGFTAGVVLGSSHYLMEFNRIAYNNTHMIFFSILVILLLVMAWRTQRAVLVYATGVAMGFCVHTIHGAKAIWVVVALMIATSFSIKAKWKQACAIIIMLVGMSLVVIPSLLSNDIDNYVDKAKGQFFNRDKLEMKPSQITQITLLQSSLAFFLDKGPWYSHYIGGPLVDPITSTLLILGIILSCFCIQKRFERLILLWFVTGMFLIALSTNQILKAPITRLLYLLPPVALLAGTAVSGIQSVLRSHCKMPHFAIRTLIFIILMLIPIINFYQMHVLSPQRLQSDSFNLKVKALQEYPDRNITEIGNDERHDGNFFILLDMRPELKPRYKYINLKELHQPVVEESGEKLPIFISVIREQEAIQLINETLSSHYNTFTDFDLSGSNHITLFIPK